MVDFVFSQPDGRAVKFFENKSKDECGCIMIHYGKVHFPNQFNRCGDRFWTQLEEPGGQIGVAELECSHSYFIPKYTSTTYKEIKEHLLVKGHKPSSHSPSTHKQE